MKTFTKTTTKVTLTLLLCLVSSIVFAERLNITNDSNKNFKYTKNKSIDKEFDARSYCKLNLYGKYSDYKIVTCDDNQISFHVEITTKSNKEKDAEEMLNNINIEINDSKSSETIEAKTTIKNKKMFNINFQIEYYIKIPRNMYLTIENSYGKVEIDKLNKDIVLDLKYGDFTIDSLLSNNNKIDIIYSDAKIKHANWINGELRYSDIRINNGKNIDLNMTYSNGKFGEIKKLTATCEYSEVNCNNIDYANMNIRYTDTYFDKVKEVAIENSYSDVEIDYLIKKITFNSTYGDIEINKLDKDFKRIDIKSKYSDVYLILSEDNVFTYYVSAEYGQIDCKYLKEHARVYIYELNKEKMGGNINDREEHNIWIEVKYGDVEIDIN